MNIKIKTTYLILGTALTFSSCSQEEMPCNKTSYGSDRKIIFRSSLPEVTTRGKVNAKDDLTYFRITAFEPEEEDSIKNGILCEYIKNDTLFFNNETGRFFAEDCVWPEVGKEDHVLHFFAYYPHLSPEAEFVNNTSVGNAVDNVEDNEEGDVMVYATEEAKDKKTSFDYKIKNFRVASEISDHIDFVTAYASGTMEEKEFEGIKLEFYHKLSRIELTAKSSSKSYKLEIAGVRIGGIRTQGTFSFKAVDDAGDWAIDDDKDDVEYIYRPGDKIVTLDNTSTPVSIMGGSDGINYAMLLPSSYKGWDFANDHTNSNKELFISVLLRVLDKTPGGNDKQQYPYYDNSQGLNAMNIPRVYLAVDGSGKVTANPGQLYKENNGRYYTDAAKLKLYSAPQGSTVKEFGWAALPVTGNWEPGYAYTYTLDYTYGVGLHDPSVEDPKQSDSAFPGPMAGDPIISDRVGVSVSVNVWQGGDKTTHDFEVPGS